jgi:uncharacterized repeat protein (TIGR03803 family)
VKSQAARFFLFAMFAFFSQPIHCLAQAYSVLYNFGAHAGDPGGSGNPGIIAQGRDGDLYSTTWARGANGYGAVFKITTSGRLTVLHSFNLNDEDGYEPYSGLTLGTDGYFYGTTSEGGSSGSGTAFRISPSGTFTTLHEFTGGSDGANPCAAPIQGTDGNFYGTTPSGGLGFGTVYKMTPSGTVTSLHQFDGTDGAYSLTPLILATDGNFYGTTTAGGMFSLGTVFKVTSTGTLTLLYSADSTTAVIEAPLIQGSDGNFYTATVTGYEDFGVVFKMEPSGVVTILHDFNGTTDGGNPFDGLVQATDGNLYGTTNSYGEGYSNAGTFYRISPKGAFSVIHTFNGTDGASSYVTPMQHTNGMLYGDTHAGGTYAEGVFYGVNVGLKPFVSLVSSSGKVGQSIGILGQGFTGTTGVSFDGTAAPFKVASPTYLTATVPNRAKTGFVTVITPKGTLRSNRKFQVRP